MQVAENKMVSIHYTLTDKNGATIDSSVGAQPLEFLTGGSQIIKGLEDALMGKNVGDTFDVEVKCEDGYGPRNDDLCQSVPMSAFGDNAQLEAGMRFQAQTDAGMQIFTVVQVEGDSVVIDANHPMAGVDLYFNVEVVAVREATADELTLNQPAGCGSGGCSSCSSGCGE